MESGAAGLGVGRVGLGKGALQAPQGWPFPGRSPQRSREWAGGIVMFGKVWLRVGIYYTGSRNPQLKALRQRADVLAALRGTFLLARDWPVVGVADPPVEARGWGDVTGRCRQSG